ncbi:MAG: PhoH family protein [Gammaproteobacteria bacterium]|nr:PhoH family protein [Gammaproteobacteria bacterium]
MNRDSSNRQKKAYVLDTNVLIHDPNSLLNFEDNQVIIPITVLEELDRLKTSKQAFGADCRSAIRLIDSLLQNAPPESIASGVPIQRKNGEQANGSLSVLMTSRASFQQEKCLPDNLSDNQIINRLCEYQKENPDLKVVLVTKDINMRLKARACGIASEDYHNDQLVSDIRQLTKGFINVEGSFWEHIGEVESKQIDGHTYHRIPSGNLAFEVFANQFIVDGAGFVARVQQVDKQHITLWDLRKDRLLQQKVWGLTPRNIYQAFALNLLLDPNVHLVTLTGAAGSGKTILALAAALEMTVEYKLYNKIIVTRSTPPLAEEHGFLPGTEEEKMDPWLGGISDNLEALHIRDEKPQESIAYIKSKANIELKALNYIRGRSFQKSLIIIDECQNLTPYQMKAILTRAGEGSKVVCLGNLAQIDTPYLTPTSSGLTYMTERFKGFTHGGSIQLNGVPRSLLAEFAESNL